MIRELLQQIYLNIFCWAGTKLFDNVCFYCGPNPEKDNTVQVMHFFNEDKEFVESCREIIAYEESSEAGN